METLAFDRPFVRGYLNSFNCLGQKVYFTSFSSNYLSRWILLLRAFARVSPNFLDSVGQMAFRFLYDQFFQSAFFALWIALRCSYDNTGHPVIQQRPVHCLLQYESIVVIHQSYISFFFLFTSISILGCLPSKTMVLLFPSVHLYLAQCDG